MSLLHPGWSSSYRLKLFAKGMPLQESCSERHQGRSLWPSGARACAGPTPESSAGRIESRAYTKQGGWVNLAGIDPPPTAQPAPRFFQQIWTRRHRPRHYSQFSGHRQGHCGGLTWRGGIRGIALRQLQHAIQHGGRGWPDRRSVTRAVHVPPRSLRGVRVRRSRRAPRADGTPRLPGGTPRDPRGTGRLPGDVPGLGSTGRIALGAGLVGALAPSGGLGVSFLLEHVWRGEDSRASKDMQVKADERSMTAT